MDDAIDISPRATVVAVLSVALLCFGPALMGGFVWDDQVLIVDTPLLSVPQSLWELVSTPFWSAQASVGHSVTPLYAQLHRPLTKLVFFLGMKAGEATPLALHLLSLLLHIGCSLLVYDDVRSRLHASSTSRATATFAALAFAVHPTRVESVSWISGLTDVLMTFFLLIGMRALRLSSSAAGLLAATTAFALAGWSKEVAVLAPIIIVADSYSRGRSPREIFRGAAATFVGASLVGITWFLSTPRSPSVGWPSPAAAVPRVLATVGTFVSRIVWPMPATVYPGRIVIDGAGTLHFDPMAIAIGTMAIAALCIALLRAWRHPPSRTWLGPLALFFVPLLPVSNFVLRNNQALAADRYLYLPLVGVIALAAAPLSRALGRGPRQRTVTVFGFGCLFLAACVATVHSSERFADDRALFEHEVSLDPGSHVACQELARLMRAEGDFDGASRVLARALRIAKRHGDRSAQVRLGLAYLRTELGRRHDLDQSGLLTIRAAYDGVAHDGKVRISAPHLAIHVDLSPASRIEVMTDTEGFAIPRAQVHARTGDPAGAARLLAGVLRRQPDHAEAYNLRAVVLARGGDYDGALETLTLGGTRAGGPTRFDSARTLVERARTIAERPVDDPTLAIVRDANVQLILGSPGAARAMLEPVVRAHPDVLVATLILAHVEASDRLPERARALLDAAEQRFPGDANIAAQRADLTTRFPSLSLRQ